MTTNDKEMKAIVLSRVSTLKQDLIQQTNELLKEAKRDGYTDIVTIENKESGISNDEEHLNGIQQMKQLILNDESIKAVYVYEVSRLSRRPTVLYSIRDFLLENEVQLVILKPYLRLIDPDGSMSQSASIMFSLFASISESEMMIKKERMMRGKHQKMAQGKYSGGNICFGYDVSKDKSIIIDDDKAAIVHKIYDMYTESDESVRTIASELMQTGEIPQTEYENAVAFIKFVLKSKQYIGGKSAKGLVYPAIISRHQYDKARAKSISARKSPKSKSKYEFLAKKLLHYKGTDRLMTASKTNYSISSIKHSKFWSISSSAIDSIAWHYAKMFFQTNMSDPMEQAERIRQECISLRKKFNQCYNLISKLKEKHERIENRILNGKMDESKGDQMLEQIANEVAELKEQADLYEFQRRMKHEQMKAAANSTMNLNNDISNSDKISIIRQTIKDMQIESTEGYGCSSLDIIFVDDSSVTVEIQKKNRYLHVLESGVEVAL